MSYPDFHIHTTFCDGKSNPEDIVKRAIEMGMPTLGFSAHCPMTVDSEYFLSRSGTIAYHKKISELKSEYGDRIKILCGIEQDVYSPVPAVGFDYIIGTVHYLKRNMEFAAVDHSEKKFVEGVEKFFGGDYYAFAEEYFRLMGEVVERTNADIIGHFDLLTKFNEEDRLFDSKHPRYVEAYMAAIEKLVGTGKPFEINTGAISRGYRTAPYPSEAQIREIARLGGKFIMSSDSHHCDTLCFRFDEWRAWAESLGAEFVEL